MAEINGLWTFKDQIDFSEYVPDMIMVNFNCNGKDYIGFTSYFGPVEYIDSINEYGEATSITAHNGVTWVDEKYKIINFGVELQQVPEDFYIWFIQNAVGSNNQNLYVIRADTLITIGRAIRQKSKEIRMYSPLEMAEVINDLPTFDEGYTEGYDQGHNEGYNIGQKEGYQEGYLQASETYYYYGYEEGYLVGFSDGVEETYVLFPPLGKEVGF